MQEVIKHIVEKVGISEEQAKHAVETMLTYVKTKLPAPIAAQIESALKGEGVSSAATDVLGKLGGMFGGK